MKDSSERSKSSSFFESASRRISFWGLVIVGFIAIFSALSSSRDLVGIGICLMASTIAFAALRWLFMGHAHRAEASAMPSESDRQINVD